MTPRVEDHMTPRAEDHMIPRVEDHMTPRAEDHMTPRAEDHMTPRAEDHRGYVSPDEKLAGYDGDVGNSVELLQQLEAVRELKLQMYSERDDFQQCIEHSPGLALEHRWNQKTCEG